MKTIFIVDDNDSNLVSAEEALSGDYQIYTLQSAHVMFEFLKKVTPDLILLDIEMPGMNGFEALRILKDDNATAGIPIIFVTGRNDAASEILGFEMGVKDFIQKPFSKPILRNRIKVRLEVEAALREQAEELRRLRAKLEEAGLWP